MPIHKERIEIPIYDCRVWLIVAEDLAKERKKWEYLFGPCGGTDYDALCSYSGGHSFALFFKPKSSQDISIVAHEVFHLTHRILEWTSSNFDSGHHEQGALLHGYLMNLILPKLAKIKRKK